MKNINIGTCNPQDYRRDFIQSLRSCVESSLSIFLTGNGIDSKKIAVKTENHELIGYNRYIRVKIG